MAQPQSIWPIRDLVLPTMIGPASSPTSRRLPDIEVLRGLAVAGVVLHHSYGNLLTAPHALLGLLQQYVDYRVGVDLFFVISGFVIARALLPAIAACNSPRAFATVAGAFWIRRAWRLMPSAWLWLAVILAASAWFNRAGLFGSVSANAWATLAGVLDYANARFASMSVRPFYASFAWWSLSLEEQFYALLPPLAFLLGRRLTPVALALVVLQFPLHPHSEWPVVFRSEPILIGILLAIWEGSASYRAVGCWAVALPRMARVALILGLIVVLGILGHHGLTARFGIGLIALVSGALVFLAAQDRGLILGAGAVRSLFIWVGARSYAIYLIHAPAFLAAREIWFRIGPQSSEIPVALTALALLLVGAELNWRLVERPLRAYGVRVADRFVMRREESISYVEPVGA